MRRRGLTLEKVDPFAEYLRTNGAEILELTNQYELLRYKMPECGVVVIYTNAKGRITMPLAAKEHFNRYKKGKALKTHKRAGADAKRALAAKITERDGHGCCFCGQFLDGCGEMDRTLEHFLATFHGGTNHLGNVALAHERCNLLADNLSIMEKIRLRDQIHVFLKDKPPWEFVDPTVIFNELRTAA